MSLPLIVGLSFLATLLATGGALVALAHLPVDFLLRPTIPRVTTADWARLIIRNVLGVVALVVGMILVLPGVPGPGVATMLLGFLLLDFPGKRRLEGRLLRRPHLLATVNGLRRRMRRPPLMPPAHPDAPADAILDAASAQPLASSATARAPVDAMPEAPVRTD